MSSLFGIKRLFNFIGEVKAEIDKVTWPSRNEVVITTIVVFAIALVASLFFALVDTAWYRVVHSIIGG